MPLRIDTLQFLKFKRRHVKMKDKLRWNHFNQLFPFEVEAIGQPSKQLSKLSVRRGTQDYLFENFLQTIIKTYVAELNYSKLPCLQQFY